MNKKTKELTQKQKKFTREQIVALSRQVGFKGDLKEFKMGLLIEQEHRNTVGNNRIKFAQIAKDHLNERKDYYTRLVKFVEK
jgi:hypothetical protein